MTRGRTVILAATALLFVAVSAVILNARDTRYERFASPERILYLRSPTAARRLALSFSAVMADLDWIRTIQHYGRDRRDARSAHPQHANHEFELLQPLLDLTTTLDPRFNIAYRFGAIFLSLPYPDGPGRVDQAIALLEKGLARSPNRWHYAMDIGYLHYWYTGDARAAASWFARAASLPNAPEWLRPLAAATMAQGGDRNGARTILRELQRSEEKWIRQAADRALLQIDALDQLDALNARVEAYRGRVIGDPTGTPYEYDRATNRFVLSDRSPLSPLPSAFTHK